MVAPLTAIIMPLVVSPIFMVEVSTAATIVSSSLGFNGMGCNCVRVVCICAWELLFC